MEFWGVEVKAGEPLKVEPDEKILHLSLASLGEIKKDKGNESIPIFVKIGGQKLILGTLSPEKCTHISFDLLFEKEFELSHNWKNGSVYFCGYKTVWEGDVTSDDFTDSDFGEDLPLDAAENGKPEPKDKKSKPTTDKANASKPDSSAAKPKVKVVKPNKEDKFKEVGDEDDDSDDDVDEDDSEEDESDDEDMLVFGNESDDDEESSDEEDEATPKKAKSGKKRPAESATKTPVAEKKAKFVTPQKTGTDLKKGGGHTATPHPSKQAGKSPANSDKAKQQTPKSSQVMCKTCSKTFNTDNALQSHTKAKHSVGK